ncbi:unnamed protein product [Soboliphyme baturini]|uniref:Ion_trans_2 domain-containing protein n=1 Tax=Soboliphyme baturini TaxID=241478 RepID=A0A183IQU8_9BILA|nr:unnamed protein product [Soboliphyme baturini]
MTASKVGQHLRSAWSSIRLLFTAIRRFVLRYRLLPMLALILYTVSGGVVFLFIERSNKPLIDTSPSDISVTSSIIRQMYQHHLTRWLWSSYLRNETVQRRKQLIRNAWKWYDKRVGDLNKCTQATAVIPWDIWSSIYYAMTLYTTIGYGNLAPSTNVGRVVSLIYALFGIPLLLYILDFTGKALLSSAERAMRWFIASHPNLSMKLHLKEDVPLTAITVLFVFWLCFCSALFLLWETDWDFFTSFYFVFISFSTIGLGDVVPHHPKYTLMCSIFVVFGLSVVSMLISSIQAKLERLFESFLKNIQEEYHMKQSQPENSKMMLEGEDSMEAIQQVCKPKALEEKILFNWMSSDKKQRLRKEWAKRCQMVNTETQTTLQTFRDCAVQSEEDEMFLPGYRPFYIYNTE